MPSSSKIKPSGLSPHNLDIQRFHLLIIVKRYPEPMAHGPEACEPSHPLGPMARRPASRHTRAEAVDTGYPCSLTHEIWNPISNQ